jgi:hypothetical protein
MNKILASISALALLCTTGLAVSGEYKLPEADPLVSITFPTDWSVEAQDDNVTAMSPDEAIEIDFWAVDQEDLKADAKATLEATGQEIGELLDEYLTEVKTEKPVETNHNGLDLYDVSGKAKEKDGGADVNFSMTLMTPDNKNLFVMLYWGSDEAEKDHADALLAIAQSLKKL